MADDDVCNLLREWGLSQYMDHFKENAIDIITLQLLETADIKELLTVIGHRTLFTKNLNAWRKAMHPSMESIPEGIIPVSEHHLSFMSGKEYEVLPSNVSFPLNEILSDGSNSLETESDLRLVVEDPQPSTSTAASIEPCAGLESTNSNTHCQDLQQLLESSLEGKGLLNLDKSSPLENVARHRLVRIICTNILQKKPDEHITAQIYGKWAQEIVRLFPKERITVYFFNKIVNSGRGIINRLAGKLPDQIHNLKRKYRETGVIAKRIGLSSSSPAHIETSTTLNLRLPESLEVEEDELAEEFLLWLKNSSDPWITVEEKWMKTTVTRLRKVISENSISGYFDLFPALQKPLGYLLLEKDFDCTYRSHAEGLIDNFPLIKEKLFNLAEKRKNKQDQYFNFILSLKEASEETTNILAFLLIPSLLAISTIRLQKASKKVWRPTKAEVRDGLITHATSDAHVKEVLHLRRKKFQDFGLTLQPFIIIVGESLNDIQSIFVIIDNVTYRIPNILAAVNVCFKIIWVVNAQYPAESHCTWLFIQKAFYKLHTKNDKESTATNTLLSELGLLP